MKGAAWLLSELRRRKVLRVAAAYAVVAWGVIEVSNTILQMLAGPAWIAKLILAVLAVGFPLALVLAWFFDLSSSGLVRTPPLGADAAAPPRSLSVAVFLVILAISASLTGLAIWLRPDRAPVVTFVQLTNFADAATAPTLSPDGRTLAFLKGARGFFGNSATPSQVYVKQLPDGAEVQLTNSAAGKATPTFSPDGSRVYFTSTEGNFHWNTHVVSVNGGHETELLPNASGLGFLDDRNVLFAEIDQGRHMGIRAGTLARESVRDVYWPPLDGMAHRVAASPDRDWVLIVEMDAGVWQPCRLVPLDGSSHGRQVGPPASQCTYVGWSPDGRWMYFSANVLGAFHLWRQRFPDGQPEQLTHGPTEEEGIAVAPDGRSLITSAGVRHNSIWQHGVEVDRPISVENYAFSPVVALDGRRVYFLSRAGIAPLAYDIGRLVVTDVETGARNDLLPGHLLTHFDLSADDRQLVFASGSAEPDRRGIWIAAMDRTAAPRRLLAEDVERVFFDDTGNIYFLQGTSTSRYLHRLAAPGYTVNERVLSAPVRYVFDVSPDGDWVAAVMDVPDGRGLQQVAISTRGLPTRVICGFCGGGAGPVRIFGPALSWTRDGRAMLVSAQFIGYAGMRGPPYTVILPVTAGAAVPALPPGGIADVTDYLQVPGARRIDQENVFPGATPTQLFYYQATTIRNLYRVELR